MIALCAAVGVSMATDLGLTEPNRPEYTLKKKSLLLEVGFYP